MNDDLISRQAAKDAINEHSEFVTSGIRNGSKVKKIYKMACNHVIDTISILPAIQPQQKTGQWIMHIDNLFPCESTQECSVCHAEQLITGNDDNFCPCCGAKMETEEKG